MILKYDWFFKIFDTTLNFKVRWYDWFKQNLMDIIKIWVKVKREKKRLGLEGSQIPQDTYVMGFLFAFVLVSNQNNNNNKKWELEGKK